MAENLDPNEVEQFNRNMQELNSILPSVVSGLADITGAEASATKATKDGTAATQANTTATQAAKDAAKAKTDADKEAKEAAYNMQKAFNAASSSLKSMTDAVMKTEASFGKYNGAIESAGDAAVALGKNFGVAGLAIGTLVKGLTIITQLYTKQADAVLKASDDMSKMGTAGQLTSKEILDMGHSAGLWSGNIEILTKSVKSIGTGMMSLGSTVGDGTKEFAKMTAVSVAQREAFQRLGISQEELMQSQADYVSLQAKSGIIITDQMKSGDGLKKASLEYTANLLQLSAVTGKNVDEIKKEQAVARAEWNYRLKQTQLSMEAADLEKAGKTKEAEQVRARIAANDKLLDKAIATGDKQQVAAVQSLVSTEAVTEQSAVLLRQGQDTTSLLKGLKEGKDVSAQYEKQQVEGTMKNIKNLGSALAFSEDSAKQFGVAGEGVAYAAQRYGKDLDEGRNKAKAAIGDPSKGTTGKKVGEDPAQVARNNLTTAEIKAKVAVDKLVAAANPLMSGLNATTLALTALAAAAYAAIKGLGMMASGKMQGGEAGAKTASKGASVAGKAAKVAGGGLAGAALGMAGSALTDSGHEKLGAAANIGSAAATGAAFGSMLGPIGTIVGGVVGAGVGLYQNKDALFGKKPGDVLQFTGKSGSESAFGELSKSLQDRVIAAGEEYFNATGNKLIINSAKRDPEDQQRLYDETVKAKRPGIGPTGMAVAKPGNSKHERGEAVDIQQGKNDQDAISAMGKQGLIQTVPGDPVHFEMPKAKFGAITNGPDAGYAVEHHGLELTSPLKQDSILMELAKTTAKSAPESGQDDMSSMMAEMMEKMLERLDDVKNELASLNTTQSDILKYSKV